MFSKYLQHYAEAESKNIKLTNIEQYDRVIIIPVCNEASDCLNDVFSNIEDKNILIIVVVNSSIADIDTQNQLNNQLFINKLCDESKVKYHLNTYLQLLKYNDFNDILLIDKNSENNQIDNKQGVGLARKIAADVALELYVNGVIKKPWIFSTDADVILPENYFKNWFALTENHSAMVLDFEHFSMDDRLNALQYYYDFKLRYYHAGITYASSCYDYIPLGSCLILSMQAYAQVRGFPKKNAGEDFYLLNKLAKIKPIYYFPKDVKIKIKSRFSNRVPFGTGPALTKINQLVSVDDYRYYNPRCFIYLKRWMEYLDSIYGEQGLIITSPQDSLLAELYNFFNCPIVFAKSAHQITSRQRWSQFTMQWFDAFRTLKAVHFFVKKFPSMNYKQLLKSNNFAKVSNSSLQSFMYENDKT